MHDEILDYYERELSFVRQMGAEFAHKYPKVAARLLLEPDKCEDPHTERLIEAFAFLCGRIHKKIDDGLPEITEALLSIVYPHYLNPIPSQSVVRFNTMTTVPPQGYRIEAGTPLYSQPVAGSPCQFRTCYPVTLWPVRLESVQLSDPKKPVPEAQQALVLRLATGPGGNFSQLSCKGLRFFLNAPGQHVFQLYEILLNNVCRIECQWLDARGTSQSALLSPQDIKPVGFEPDEGVLPHTQRSFPGYVLLFEYFCFPEKFLFFDLEGLGKVLPKVERETLEVWIYLNRTPSANLLLGPESFALNAVPVVNLFNRIAEPIQVEQRKTEYRVIPDIRRTGATEVFSIDGVFDSESSSRDGGVEFRPFYSLKHGEEQDEPKRRAYWHSERRPSGVKGDEGTELFLSFSDPALNPAQPEVESLTVYTTCTNRDLPAQLPFGTSSADFEMELAAPVESISCLVRPTRSRRPSLAGGDSGREGGRNPLLWRLISHLSLNYLSLVEGGEEALREILKIYDIDDSPATRQQIGGIVSLASEHVTRRVGQAFCRGVQVTVQFDEEKFVGGGHYLFASVLERFLGQYVSVNSFSQLVATTVQSKEVLKKWPPRSGTRVLL